eukprot:Amastigsp_a508786_626.p2 type:complete len:180 gc:universal Amastigsp_a508786_626:218-757(+)
MIEGSEAKRGVLRRRSAVTTAGIASETVSEPPSMSRTTWSSPPAIETLDAKVPCGHESSPARSCPVWFESSSIACLPMSTRFGFSCSTSFFKTFATPRGSTPSSASTRIPRSAPIAIAVRSVSWHLAGPIDTATISVTSPASLSFTASSTASSSKGFIDILTDDVSTPFLSARTRTRTE